MKKLMITAAAVAALAGSAYTMAVAAPGDKPEAPGMQTMQDSGFMMDAKLAGMKAALKLTPDQEKMWPTFEAAVRDADKMRRDAMREQREEMGKEGPPSPIARLDDISNRLSQASEELKKVADAAKPLYDSLDATQKHHFGPLLMMLRGPGPWGSHEGPHGQGGPMDHHAEPL